MTDNVSDEAFAEWYADAQPPNGKEPRDLVPYEWARAAWKECRDRAAQPAQQPPTLQQIAEEVSWPKQPPSPASVRKAERIMALFAPKDKSQPPRAPDGLA